MGDDLIQIVGIAESIKRKAQAMGAVARRRWLAHDQSLKYVQREVDAIYNACKRIQEEFGK